MKRINNFIMAIAAATMITSCTDEGPSAIRTASQIEITDITPVSAIVRMDKTSYYDINIQIKSQQEQGDYVHGNYSSQLGPLYYDNGRSLINYADNLAPGTTYDYKIVGTCRGSNAEYIDVELPSGSFTTPTIEEYYGKCKIVEQSYPTANSVELKFKLPDNVSTEYDDYHVCCSTSPDFTEEESLQYPVVFSEYDPTEFSCFISGLLYGTQYYIKISGDFKCSSYINADYQPEPIDLSSTVNDYLLETEPASFSTLGVDETDTPCSVTADYILDTSAKINIRLPDSWSFNTDETTDRSVIYSTDRKFRNYKVADDVLWNNDGCTCTCTFHNNLLPETCYYVALKGDFRYVKYDDYEIEMMNAVLPAEPFTTVHANQYTLVNGHKAVDLGLSVKWASCNLGATSPEENGDYFEWPSIPNVMYNTETESEYDIAGTEYDIAANQWGAGWAMPTQGQWEELANNCKIIFCGTEDNEHCLVIGANGNYICIPKSGYYYYYNEYLSSGFRYWTSNASNGYSIAIIDIYDSYYGTPEFTTMDYRSRLPIRAVAK